MFFIRSHLDEGFSRLYVPSVERGFCSVPELFPLLLMLGRGSEGKPDRLKEMSISIWLEYQYKMSLFASKDDTSHFTSNISITFHLNIYIVHIKFKKKILFFAYARFSLIKLEWDRKEFTLRNVHISAVKKNQLCYHFTCFSKYTKFNFMIKIVANVNVVQLDIL